MSEYAVTKAGVVHSRARTEKKALARAVGATTGRQRVKLRKALRRAQRAEVAATRIPEAA